MYGDEKTLLLGTAPAIGGIICTNLVAGAAATTLYASNYARDVLTTLTNGSDAICGRCCNREPYRSLVTKR